MRRRPRKDDSEGRLPSAALARSSSKITTDPPPTPDGAGKVTSHSVPPASNAEEGPEVPVAEVIPSAGKQEAEDQGERTSPVRRDLERHRSPSLVPTISRSSGRAQTSPAPLTGSDAGRASSPLLGPGGAGQTGPQQAVVAAINASSLLPEHRAILGMAFTKFQQSHAGIDHCHE